MNRKDAPIEMDPGEFRKVGNQLVDQIAAFLKAIREKPVTEGASPSDLRKLLGPLSLPQEGRPAEEVILKSAELLMNHSLLNGHPKFMGYITSSPAPIGMLADLLAAAVNPNVGAQILSPIATEIEKQTVRWLAEFIGVPSTYGGILVSGGNMANFTAFLSARTAKAPAHLKEGGLGSLSGELVFYCSKATHTWIEKAAILFGHGTGAIRWIPTREDNRMDITVLQQRIQADRQEGKKPFLVIGNAGDVSMGTVDDLAEIAAICRSHDLWFHVDGAYGAPAASVPDLKGIFDGLQFADSIALDPHKWLYAPLEAGCTLVKNPQHLIDTYSSHPVYYNFSSTGEEPPVNFYEYGFQNSRGFRALKVWMAVQQIGREGYIRLIRQDIALAQRLYDKAAAHPDLEAMSRNLSITTFRYRPTQASDETYLNVLNEKLLNILQRGGEVFLSNAMVRDKYCLRSCIVNFRTSDRDIDEIIEIVAREGRKLHETRLAWQV